MKNKMASRSNVKLKDDLLVIRGSSNFKEDKRPSVSATTRLGPIIPSIHPFPFLRFRKSKQKPTEAESPLVEIKNSLTEQNNRAISNPRVPREEHFLPKTIYKSNSVERPANHEFSLTRHNYVKLPNIASNEKIKTREMKNSEYSNIFKSKRQSIDELSTDSNEINPTLLESYNVISLSNQSNTIEKINTSTVDNNSNINDKLSESYKDNPMQNKNAQSLNKSKLFSNYNELIRKRKLCLIDDHNAKYTNLIDKFY